MDFVDHINALTATKELAQTRDFIKEVIYCHSKRTSEMLEAVKGQADLARQQEKMWWLKGVAKQSETWRFGTAAWVDEHLHRQSRPKAVAVESKACFRDIRLKTDSTIVVNRYSEGKSSAVESVSGVATEERQAPTLTKDVFDLLETREDLELDYEDDLDDELDLTVENPVVPSPELEVLPAVTARRSTSRPPPSPGCSTPSFARGTRDPSPSPGSTHYHSRRPQSPTRRQSVRCVTPPVPVQLAPPVVTPPSTTTVPSQKRKADYFGAAIRSTKQQRAISSTGNSKRKQGCPISWCPALAQYRYPKGHTYAAHIPTALHIRDSSRKLVEDRRKALLFIAAAWGETSLEDFVGLLNDTDWFADLGGWKIPAATLSPVKELNQLIGYADTRFTCLPISSPGMLLHWEILRVVLGRLTVQQYVGLQETFNASDDEARQRMPPQIEAEVVTYREDHEPLPEPQVVGTEDDVAVRPWSPRSGSDAEDGCLTVVDELPLRPAAYDSHFHLDRLQAALGVSDDSLDAIAARLSPSEGYEVDVVGSVANFCDPSSYSDERTIQDLRTQGIRTVVGLHPKHARRDNSAALDVLGELVKRPAVAGVGEIGIDHSVPASEWSRHHDLIADILPHLQEEHTLVLHCRGKQGDDGDEAYTALLYHCVGIVKPRQRIHLHCFTGTPYIIRQWLRHFPNTCFGFTALVGRFRHEQKVALRLLTLDQILLETDAPYFPMPGYRYSAPGFLKVVAEMVAQIREETTDAILQASVTNGLRMYGR